jgi:hypothetical protein
MLFFVITGAVVFENGRTTEPCVSIKQSKMPCSATEAFMKHLSTWTLSAKHQLEEGLLDGEALCVISQNLLRSLQSTQHT